MKALKQFFSRFFKIRPEEFVLVQLLFLFFTIIGMVFTLGAAAGDALLLSRLGKDSEKMLPFVYLGTALTSLFMTFLYDRIQSRFKRKPLLMGVFLILSLSIVFFRISFYFVDSDFLYVFLVVWLESSSLLSMMLFFSFCGDYFTAVDARRVYGYLAGGLPLGTILAGFLLKPLTLTAGTLNALFAVAALQGLGAFWVQKISKSHEPLIPEKEEEKEKNFSLKQIFSNRYLLLLAGFIFISFICFRLVEYLFQVRAASEMNGESLTLFFGEFYFTLGFFQILIQFGLVSLLLKKLGAVNSLMILPLLMILSHGAQIFFPGLFLLWVSGNFFRLSFSETVDIAAMELLFLPLPKKMRHRAQAFFSGAFIPLGSGLGGALILFVLPFFSDLLFFVYLAVFSAFLYLLTIFLIRPQYRKMLSHSLKGREFEPSTLKLEFKAETAEKLFSDLRQSRNLEEISLTLDILSKHGSSKVFEKLEGLLNHALPQAALAALNLAGEKNPVNSLEIFKKALDRPETPLQRRALYWLARRHPHEGISIFTDLLKDSRMDLKYSAAAALTFTRQSRRGWEILQTGLQSPSESEAEKALTACLHMEIALPPEILGFLAAHSSLEIRKKAVTACSFHPASGHLEFIMNAIQDPALSKTAFEAFMILPAETLSGIGAKIFSDEGSFALKNAFFKVLEKKGIPSNTRILTGFVLNPQEPMLLKVAAGRALRAIYRRHEPASDPNLLHSIDFIAHELSLIHQAFFGACGFSLPLAEHLRDRGLLLIDVLISLLSAFASPVRLKKIENNFQAQSPVIRSNALELLEFSLPQGMRLKVLSAVQPFVLKERPQNVLSPQEVLEALLNRDIWLSGLIGFFYHPGELQEKTMNQEQKSIFQLILKTRFLKKIRLFQELPSEYLIHLAEVTEEKTYEPGEILMREGEEGDALFLIQEGEVEVLKGSQPIARLGEGECIGEMALIEDMPRSATAVAKIKTRVLRVDKEDFVGLMDSQPAVVKALLITLARRIRERG